MCDIWLGTWHTCHCCCHDNQVLAASSGQKGSSTEKRWNESGRTNVFTLATLLLVHLNHVVNRANPVGLNNGNDFSIIADAYISKSGNAGRGGSSSITYLGLLLLHSGNVNLCTLFKHALAKFN